MSSDLATIVGVLGMIAARVSSNPPHIRQRLTRTLVGRLPFLARPQVVTLATATRMPHVSASNPLSTRCDRVQSPASARTSLELCERPEMQAMVAAFESRRSLSAWLDGLMIQLPAMLDPIPDRVCDTRGMRAAGFSLRSSRSVRVDIASWQAPENATLDARAWQRMFAWLVTDDTDLQQVDRCAELLATTNAVSGQYTFQADGIEGHGILTLSTLPCGSWRVIDCWGDAAECADINQVVDSLTSR